MSIKPAIVNFRLYAYSTFTETVTLKGSDGDPIDLTGYTARGQARRRIEDAAAVLTFSTTNGSIVLGDAAGTIVLRIEAPATGALIVDTDGEQWVYDLLLTHPSATQVDRTLQGVIVVIPGVTRS